MGVCFLAGNVLLAPPVAPGEVNSTDVGDKQKIFQFLDGASPELISFLQRVGALIENTGQKKKLATHVQYDAPSSAANGTNAPSGMNTLSPSADGASVPSSSTSGTNTLPLLIDGTIDLGSRVGAGASGNTQCAVFLFGNAQFAPQECDDTTDGLRTRSLPFGVIKPFTREGLKVALQNPPLPSNFQLLVYVPGQNPIWHIVDYESVVATTSSSSQTTSSNQQTTQPNQQPIPLTPLEAFFKSIDTTLASVEAQTLARKDIYQNFNAKSGKEKEFLIFNFLNNFQEEFIPLAEQVGLLSKNESREKTLTAPLCLERFFHPYPENNLDERNYAIHLNHINFEKPFAVSLLSSEVQLAPWECDDVSEENELRVRSLPGGWLLKNKNSVVNVVLPSWGEREIINFKLVLFFPGEHPQWQVREYICFSQRMTKIIKTCLEWNGGALKEECRKALVGNLLDKGKVQSTALMANDLNSLMTELKNARHPNFVISLSDEGCPKWGQLLQSLQSCHGNDMNADMSQLMQALAVAESTGRYLYAPNAGLNCNNSWHESESALSRALFLLNGLPPASVRALREAYLRLAIRHQKSPEWIHRVLTLYLAMHPYDVFEFRSGLSGSNVNNFVIDFFNQHCAPVLNQHSDEVVDEPLVWLFLNQQKTKLFQWKTDETDPNAFGSWKEKVFFEKNARPSCVRVLQNVRQGIFQIVRQRGSSQPDSYEKDYIEAIKLAEETAQNLLLDGKSWNEQTREWVADSVPWHVICPSCLWQAFPVATPLDLLKSCFPTSGNINDIKRDVRNMWVDGGLLDCTTINGELNDSCGASTGCKKETVSLNATQRTKAEIVCRRILNRFCNYSQGGLQLIYALGKFLKKASNTSNSTNQEWLAIQRATGEQSFDAFRNGETWSLFVQQTMDNSILENRCCDGVYDALVSALPAIIKPSLPAIAPLYLWLELALWKYRELYLEIFDSHTRNNLEERTYGLPSLQHAVNAIFGLPPIKLPSYDGHRNGRDVKLDCLIPLKTGKFRELSDNSPKYSIFYSKNNKKNTSKRPSGIFEFTYIEPFSPVRVFYYKARKLFKEIITPMDGEIQVVPGDIDPKVFSAIMQLAFTHEEVRREYLSFVAGFPHELVTEKQSHRWDSQQGGKPTSFHALLHTRAREGVIDEFNSHLKWWKIDFKKFFYPSFDLWKLLAVDLGYAREKDEQDHDTDLRNLPQPEPLKPDFTVAHNLPVPIVPPSPPGKPTFYKHYNLRRERIDIDPNAVYDLNNPLTLASVTSPNHPKNQGDRVQPSEPKVFQAALTSQDMNNHADEVQKTLWRVCELDQLASDQMQQEIAGRQRDLDTWNQAPDNMQQIQGFKERYGTLEHLRTLIQCLMLVSQQRQQEGQQEATRQSPLQTQIQSLRADITQRQQVLDEMSRDLQEWARNIITAQDESNNAEAMLSAFNRIQALEQRYSLELEGLRDLVRTHQRELQILQQREQDLQQQLLQQQAQNSQ
jgi:hypothetical protein